MMRKEGIKTVNTLIFLPNTRSRNRIQTEEIMGGTSVKNERYRFLNLIIKMPKTAMMMIGG
jgi:hypothetical protein